MGRTDTYEGKKDRLRKQLAANASKGKVSLKKSTSNLFRSSQHSQGDFKLEVEDFNRVIDVDPKRLIAEVEGMVTYESFVKETLKHGCLPTVVPELKSITVGGAISGCGIESSSFRYGLVHETVEEFDVLLSNGEVVTCSPENAHADLYFATPNTFGTLGYVLRVKVRLMPVKPYVRLMHRRFHESGDFFASINALCVEGRLTGAPDYVEGVIFSPKECYITTGDFVDEAPYLSDYSLKKIYYRSIREREEDYLTVSDYIWRWDTDWFWCSEVFGMQNAMMRRLLGNNLLGSKQFNRVMRFFERHPLLGRVYSACFGKTESVIQDVVVPVEKGKAFYSFLSEKIGIHPIWICPTQGVREGRGFDFCPVAPNKLYLDFGFWKSIPSKQSEGYFNRMIETECVKVGGFKSLYSRSYYPEEEFWSIYDASKYLELKKKYDPQGKLRGIYEKCVLS